MKKRPLFFLSLCFSMHIICAQKSEQYFLSIIGSAKNKELNLSSLKSNIQKTKNSNIDANQSDTLSFIDSGLTELSLKRNQFQKTKKYFDLAILKAQKINSKNLNTLAYKITRSNYLFKTGNHQSALQLSKEALLFAEKINGALYLIEINTLIYKIYVALGDKKMAFLHFKAFTKIKDSVFNLIKANDLPYYQSLYETGIKDRYLGNQIREIKSLEKEKLFTQSLMVFGGISIFLVGYIILLYSNKRVLKRKRELQADYAQKILLFQENERKRISKDLHDGLGQSLLIIKNTIALTKQPKISQLINNAIEEMRCITRALHPFQLEGIRISKALEHLIHELNENCNHIYIFGDIETFDEKLNADQKVNIYRIVQECLSNIIKHAKADVAKVSLAEINGGINIAIKDNGIGFNFPSKYNNPKSIGLKIIKERVKFLKGTIRVNSIKDKGTVYNIEFPIK